MKKNLIIAIVVFLIILPTSIFCQSSTNIKDYLEELPVSLNPDYEIPQKYLMTTYYDDYDLNGNFIKKKRITGECTFMKDGEVKWNNIIVSHSQNLEEPYSKGEKQHFMENFTYNPSQGILDESFFKSVPQADITLKNLIWDLTMFQTFAWYKWDSLKLNSELCVGLNTEVNIGGIGTFNNKDIRITWIGITKINNEICAIFKYIAMNNPFEMHFQTNKINGRSHYWGNIYVSLSNKQIEYADLYEDVIVDIKMNGEEISSKANAIRKINIQKIQ